MDISINGLVISETKLTDTKKYISLISAEYGKISAVVHGAQSVKSKRLSSVQQFSYSNFVLNKKGESFVLKDVSLIKSFFNVCADPRSFALASYIASIAGYVSVEAADECRELLPLTLNALYAISETDKPCEIIKAGYELKCASLIGFEPALIACARCSSDIASSYSYLRIHEGCVLCPACAEKTSSLEYEKSFKLSPGLLAAIRYIVYSEVKRTFAFSLDESELALLNEISESYLCAHIEAAFSALKIYKALSI